MLAKRNCGLVIALLLAVSTNYHVTSSASPHIPPTPTSSPSLLPSTSSSVEKSSPSTTTTTTSSTTTLTYEEPPKKPTNSNHPSSSSSSSRPKSSSVTFLYELYEQEIYNPKTDSWTSRRFTQSPVTGGGGRDSTSLDPQSCSPPRNYLFDGEWKIDMASESRDGFGWEYYVGKYDGLGRRRRRWVRNLKRISIVSKASAGTGASAKKKSLDEKKKSKSSSSSSTKLTKEKATRTYHPGLLQAIKDDYNFKGFGWGFYKPLLRAKSVGCLLRLPLSANFDSYDKHRAAPYITTATYFGYPWVVASFLNASVPLDAVKWLFGGVIWKMQWSLAVASALVRGVLEVALWIVLWPLRLWRATIQFITTLARFGSKKKQDDVVESVIDSIDEVVAVNEEDAANTTFIDSGEGTTVSIETHIELSNSSQYKDGGELSPVLATSVAGTPRGGANSSHYTDSEELSPVLATSVADSPRGGANSSHYTDSGELSAALVATSVADSPRGGATDTTNTTTQVSTFRKKHLTLLGNEIPSFHRTTSIEYSTTIQERVGASMSLRLSQERGFEFRYNFVYTCLPTFLLWRQIEEERRRRVETARRRFVGIWGKGKSPASIDKAHKTDASRGESKSSSKSRSKSQSNALSTFLNDHSSTVGVSAGWPLPVDPYFSLNLMLSMSGFYYGWLLKFIRSLFVLPLPSLKDNKLNQSAALSSGDKGGGSSPSEKVLSSALKKKKLPTEEETDDEGISILGDSDSEECLANSTDLNVAGV